MPVLKVWRERVYVRELYDDGASTYQVEFHVLPARDRGTGCSYDTLWSTAWPADRRGAFLTVVEDLRGFRGDLCTSGNFETVKELAGCQS